jgi:NAD-dependent SIR2 family protein deacetylase
MPIHTLILGFVIIMLGGLAALVGFTEVRRRRFDPHGSNDRIFRCANCGSVYTDDADVDRSRCPQCGKLNEAIEF